MEIRRYDQKNSAAPFMQVASQVSAKTYQHALGSGIRCDDLTWTLLESLASRGWLRGHVMFLEGEPCAFQYGVVYREKFFLEQKGYDPQWKHLNVGTVLFLEALQDLCAEPDVRVMDFGFGDADYKQSYGDTHWTEASLCHFAMRPWPILANLVHSGTTGLSMSLSCVLQKTGLLGWVKRRWRDRLEKDE